MFEGLGYHRRGKTQEKIKKLKLKYSIGRATQDRRNACRVFSIESKQDWSGFHRNCSIGIRVKVLIQSKIANVGEEVEKLTKGFNL